MLIKKVYSLTNWPASATFRYHSLTDTERNTQDCGISKAAKDAAMLPSKTDQMRVSKETGS